MAKKALNENTVTRFSILFLVAFVQAANYYFYDAISPLKRTLETEFGFSSSDFGLFVAFYSVPNTFLLMAIVGGVVLDRLGIRRTGSLFVGLMTAGGLITAYGASTVYTSGGLFYHFMGSFFPDYSPELKMMLLGRFFFGLGAETSIVVISKIIVKWFKGKELALAFGTKIGIARLGSFAAFYFSPVIKENVSHWSIAIWFAALLLCIAMLAVLVYNMYDLKLDKQLNTNIKLLSDKDKFQMSDLWKLLTNRSFIFITMICLTFYSAVFPFQSFSADFFLNKFNLSEVESGKIASYLSLGTLIFTPFFGFLVDKVGKSATFMIFGSLMLVIIHITFATTMINPVIPMLFLGITFSLVPAAMWPAVAKIVDENKIGTAYGTMFSIQNLGLWAFPLLIGLVLDKTNPDITPDVIAGGNYSYDYTWSLLMLAGLGFLGLLFAILLKREDKVSGYELDLPSNKAEK
jgi:MFS family permease